MIRYIKVCELTFQKFIANNRSLQKIITYNDEVHFYIKVDDEPVAGITVNGHFISADSLNNWQLKH